MTDRYQRRFTVRGIDDAGDVHAFQTDSAEAAESVRQQMEQTLSEIDVIDQQQGGGDHG